MSDNTKKPQESGSSAPTIPGTAEQAELKETQNRADPNQRATDQDKREPQNRNGGGEKESKVHRLSAPRSPLYVPPKTHERKKPALLTVEQYLRRAKQDQGIADLIRSLHKTKVMSIADWEREAAALLTKKVW